VANIQDVAKLAGVSAGTVSRYLNGYKLKAENNERVESAIRELDYHPNNLARGLRSNRTNSIGLLIRNMRNHLAASIVAQVEVQMELHDYSIILSGFLNDPRVFERRLELMLAHKVDGIILFEGQSTWPGSRLLDGVGIPVISINSPYELPSVNSILVSDRESSAEVVTRMIECGHDQIGIIAAPQDEYVACERLGGVYDAFARAGLPKDHAHVRFGDFSPESGYNAMRGFLEEDHLDAVFACNYKMGQGALQASAELGRRIGEDLSYVTFDYFDTSDVFYPALTTVCPPVEEMGDVASHQLLEHIDNGTLATGETVTIPHKITWRHSIVGDGLDQQTVR
jgi:LacI family transcriptional regulator